MRSPQELASLPPADMESRRRELARYDARMMYLGFGSTVTWVGASVYAAGWLYAQLAVAGIPATLAFLLAVVGSVTVCRFVVLRLYGRIRDRLRRSRAAAFDGARLQAGPHAHLSPGLLRILLELRALRTAIVVPDDPSRVVVERLRAWVAEVDRLDGEDRDYVRERGLDLAPLRPLVRLAPMSGEPKAVWADRAYRRLQAAVPVLDHFEGQLTRIRDDAYR